MKRVRVYGCTAIVGIVIATPTYLSRPLGFARVTLLIGMSKAEGIYLSADFRVTEYPSGRLVDDASVKMLTVHYPPDKLGARAVLAYTGLAILPDGTPTGTWIRETLRGESEVPDQSMAHLRDRMNRDLAPRRFPLIINALIVQGERRFFGGLSNLRADPRIPGRTQVLREFEYVMTELTQPFCFRYRGWPFLPGSLPCRLASRSCSSALSCS